MTRFCHIATAIGLLAFTSIASAQVPRSLDPTQRDAARAHAAANPLGVPLRDRANADLAILGFSTNDHFDLVGASRDDLGTTHARLAQRFHGVPVMHGALIAHLDASGRTSYTDSGIRGITTSERADLSTADALRAVDGDLRHTAPFVAPPTTTLVFVPELTWTMRTGGPIPALRYDPFATVAMVEPINTDDVVKQLARVRLAWKVSGIELDATTRHYRPRDYWVDAHAGGVFDVEDSDDNAGSGTGKWQGASTFATTADGSCSHMEDGTRKFTTETDDFGSGDPVNCDTNNVWGDGAVFMGDASATTANWQTAMVDGHVGATIYWDLMANIFNLHGPDDDFYSVNVFMHDDTNWDDAAYHSLSGNVSFGDGPNDRRAQLDCLGHELGHAWNDHNSHFNSSTALNESLGDVFGEWTEAYKLSGGFAIHSPRLGLFHHANWTNDCSGRNLVNPGANGNPAYWYSSILDAEEHTGSAPASRAFTFLAGGASARMRNPNWSRLMPWGLNGIELIDAARIYYRAMHDYITDEDYAGVRTAMLTAAQAIFGVGVKTNAVRNAYRAINVGAAAAGTPAPPPTTNDNDTNHTIGTRQDLGFGMAPPVGAVADAPRKLHIVGSGNSTHFYKVSMNGAFITGLVTGTTLPLTSYTIQVVNGTTGAMIQGAGPWPAPLMIDRTFSNPSHLQIDVFLKVIPQTPTPGASYTLDIDLGI